MPSKQKFAVHEDQVYERKTVEKLIIHDFNDDPALIAGKPIYDWERSEKGQWVMKHGLDPTFSIMMNHSTMSYVILITAHITPKRWTEFCLKFS